MSNDTPPINYRGSVTQIEDAYIATHGHPLHACGVRLEAALKFVFQPTVEIAVAHGRQLQREEVVRQVMDSPGKVK